MKSAAADVRAQTGGPAERSETGEEVIVTRSGEAAPNPEPATPRTTAEARRAVLDAVRAAGRSTVASQKTDAAARSQDFLYDGNGLPR